MTREHVTTALMGVRESLQADGADLEITDLAGDKLDLKIIATDETCKDCLMPEVVIHKIIKKQLENKGLSFSEVNLDYPAV